jgi:regulator of chromosome condensation
MSDAPPVNHKKPTPAKRSRSMENSQTKRARHSSLNELVKAPKTIGNVFVFGTGDTGQLGLGEDMLERKKPMPLKVLDNEEIVDVVSGGMHSIAITKEGKVKEKWFINLFSSTKE